KFLILVPTASHRFKESEYTGAHECDGHKSCGLVNCPHAIPQLIKAMSTFTAELIGTMLLILLGDGVVANVLLNKSKGQNAGWMVIKTGCVLAVAVAVYSVCWIRSAHLNPAETLGLTIIGQFQSCK